MLLLIACVGGDAEKATGGAEDSENGVRGLDADNSGGGVDSGSRDSGGPAQVTAYRDRDGDGFGDPTTGRVVPELVDGWVLDNTDCDDERADVHRGAEETCNGIDDDCDALVDDDDWVVGRLEWHPDVDGDGFGRLLGVVLSCERPEFGTLDNTDCDDTDRTSFPGAPEVCLDAIDQDCDGLTDDYTGVCDPGLDPDVTVAGCAGAYERADVALCADGVAALLGTVAYSDVGTALRSAGSGDVVSVCPGRHRESLLAATSDVVIAGFGRDVSIIAPTRGYALEASPGTRLAVVDLALEGARPGVFPALHAEDPRLCLERVGVAGGRATHLGESSGGGGDFAGDGGLTVRSAFFYANAASSEGGALAASNHVALDVADSVFFFNHAGYSGGAIEFSAREAVSLDISHSTFVDNRAGYSGGAVSVSVNHDEPTPITVRDSAFLFNAAAYEGGGIAVGGYGGFSATISDTAFTGNASHVSGGAVALGGYGDFDLYAVGSSFHGNWSRTGGALDVGGYGVIGVVVEQSSFYGNVATSAGGAFSAGSWASAELSFSGSQFVANAAAQSAVASFGSREGDAVSFESCDITDNVASTSCGISCASGGGDQTAFTFANSTILRNAAGTEHGTVWLRRETTLTSELTDWGSEADDNVPSDFENYGYDGLASFSCRDEVCE